MFQITFSTRMCGICVWFVYFLLLFTFTIKGSVGAQKLNPAKDFRRNRVVQPTLHHGRTKRELPSTRDANSTHHSEVTITVDVEGQDYVLDLRLNEDLVTGNHTLSYQVEGKTVLYKPKKEDLDLCHYSGGVRGIPGSWVALSTCHGVRGVVFDGKKMRYIEPADGGGIQSNHYLYDHNDLNTSYRCGYEDGVTNNKKYDPELMGRYQSQQDLKSSRYKRNTNEKQVRGPYNANKQSRYVELVLVADHKEYLANGESVQTVHAQMIQVANIINSVYSPLNIFIALVGVVVWSERDEIRLEENGDNTLTGFLKYRERLVLDIPNDNAQLLTRQKFTGSVIGKAWSRTICTYKSAGVSTNHSEVIGLVATTIAHEMGHNFGMNHDDDLDNGCECAGEKCIMSPSSTSVVPVHWSSCSLKSLAVSFERGMDYCLRNKPKRLADSPTCGNGFLELGEQCDCGITGGAECRACCHHDTCMLRSNATCAAGACCDFTTCRPKAAGTVCRSADQECDLPEYCTGHSEFCPDDVYMMDTIPCGGNGVNQAYCAHGWCRSPSDQCRILWGNSGKRSHDICYMNNINGNSYGNCGYDPLHQYYKPCRPQDAMCGLLHCTHLNENLEFGTTVANTSVIFITNKETITQCQTASIDLGRSAIDPGFVPDGAKCGENKMCMNQRCLPIETIRETIVKVESSVCPSDCSGHGVCNSLGHCHCEAGFAPPLCALPGPGGSYDSGPATDPSVPRKVMIAMYMIFLGITPTTLMLFLLYYSRYDVLFWWRRPRKSYVDYFNCCHYEHTISQTFQSIRSLFRKSNGEANPRPRPIGTIDKNNIQVVTLSEPKSSPSESKSYPSESKSYPSEAKSSPSEPKSLPIERKSSPCASKSLPSVSNCFKIDVESIYRNSKMFSKNKIQRLSAHSRSIERNDNLLKSNEDMSKIRSKKIDKNDIRVVMLNEHKSPPSEPKSSPSVSKSPLSVSKSSLSMSKSPISVSKSPPSVSNPSKNDIEPIYGNSKQFSKDDIQPLSASKSNEELSKIYIVKNVRKFTKGDNKEAISSGNCTKVSKENKPNLVIIKQGLASTTNERINKTLNRTGDGIYANL